MAMKTEPKVTVRFPSVEFFSALAEQMSLQTEKYKKYGYVELRLGIRITADGGFSDEVFYGLVFNDYWCEEVKAYRRPEEFGAECTVAGPYTAWKEMFENIEAHGVADDKHTLNCLIHLDVPFHVEAENQFEADKIYRFIFSLQLFLEEAARLQVEFAA